MFSRSPTSVVCSSFWFAELAVGLVAIHGETIVYVVLEDIEETNLLEGRVIGSLLGSVPTW